MREYKVKYHISVAGFFGSIFGPSGKDIDIVVAASANEAVELVRAKMKRTFGIDYDQVKFEILDVEAI